MKRANYIILIMAIFSIGIGCTKFDDDLNLTPNQPTVASNAQLLTYVINQIPAMIESPAPLLYVQYLAEKPYPEDSRYTTINWDFYFIYAGALENLRTILNSKEFNINDGSKNNQLAVARILRAYFYWQMTDRWGDIPYSDALQGKENFTPKYDKQKDIYYDLFKELKEASTQIEEDENPVKGDILYNGDMNKWRKFANSMHMLMALRLSKVEPVKGSAEFKDAMSGPIMQNNNESAVYKHLSSEAYQNYWYYVRVVQNREWYWASNTLVDYLKPLNDPRLPVYADPNSKGEYVGVPYGIDADQVSKIASATVSPLGAAVRAQDAPTYILTYGEVAFAMAEANKLGWLPNGDVAAMQNYNDAIQASFLQWTGSVSGADAFLLQPGIAYTSSTALQQIGTQKWVHLFMNGYEAWAEWRRTGYPVLQPAPNNAGKLIPRRQAYPTKEQNINGVNYQAAVAGQPGFNGVDDLNGRVWWDTK